MNIDGYLKMNSRELRNSLLLLNEAEILALSDKVEGMLAVNMKKINESNEAFKRSMVRD